MQAIAATKITVTNTEDTKEELALDLNKENIITCFSRTALVKTVIKDV